MGTKVNKKGRKELRQMNKDLFTIDNLDLTKLSNSKLKRLNIIFNGRVQFKVGLFYGYLLGVSLMFLFMLLITSNQKLELNILRIDNDLKTKKEILELLKERISYIQDMGVFHVKSISKIELIYKTKYSAKIYLNCNLKDEKNIIILQLLLSSDWRKETNTILNHFKLNQEYSNRMFDVKRYPRGIIRHANITNVTKEVLDYVNSKERKKFRN